MEKDTESDYYETIKVLQNMGQNREEDSLKNATEKCEIVDTSIQQEECEQMQINVAYMEIANRVSSGNYKAVVADRDSNVNTGKKRKFFMIVVALCILSIVVTATVVTVTFSVPLLNVEIQSLESDAEMQVSALKIALNGTRKGIEELEKDLVSLSSQLSVLASLTNDTMTQCLSMHANLTSKVSALQNQLNTSQYEFARADRLELISFELQMQIDAIQNNVRYNCGPGLWRRVAHLNMSDPSHQCPPVWREYSANGVRACGRPTNAQDYSCYSISYSSAGSYTKVCGQVIGYQVGSTDVFGVQQFSIDTAYVDGVSITYGQPRNHIWTYAAGLTDILASGVERYSCPCRLSGTPFTPQEPPSYVGSNYYCESGNVNNTYAREANTLLMYTDDPLWDGKNCEGRCCSDGRTPPWFSVQLTGTTTSNIEVRICGAENTTNDDTTIKLLEIYVQ